MDRARLCLTLACAAAVLTACGEPATPGHPSTSDQTTTTTTTTATTTTTTTASTPATSGYPLPVGDRKTAPDEDYAEVELNVGDVVVVDVADGVGTGHDPKVVVLAEITDDGYAFQAVGTGHTIIVRDDPTPAPGCDPPDCDGLPAPPSLDVTVR